MNTIAILAASAWADAGTSALGCLPTLQEAILFAHAGDTVYVEAGTYDGPIVVDKDLDFTIARAFSDCTEPELLPIGRATVTVAGGVNWLVTGGATVSIARMDLVGGATAGVGEGGVLSTDATTLFPEELVLTNVTLNGGAPTKAHACSSAWETM